MLHRSRDRAQPKYIEGIGNEQQRPCHPGTGRQQTEEEGGGGDQPGYRRQFGVPAAVHLAEAIGQPATGEYAGEVVLNDLDPANRSCGFRIGLRPAFQGRGLGSEATRLIVDHAFAVGIHRIELEVYAFNPRARHVYERAGFTLEGTTRDALLWDGEWVDAHVMSMLATDGRG